MKLTAAPKKVIDMVAINIGAVLSLDTIVPIKKRFVSSYLKLIHFSLTKISIYAKE